MCDGVVKLNSPPLNWISNSQLSNPDVRVTFYDSTEGRSPHFSLHRLILVAASSFWRSVFADILEQSDAETSLIIVRPLEETNKGEDDITVAFAHVHKLLYTGKTDHCSYKDYFSVAHLLGLLCIDWLECIQAIAQESPVPEAKDMFTSNNERGSASYETVTMKERIPTTAYTHIQSNSSTSIGAEIPVDVKDEQNEFQGRTHLKHAETFGVDECLDLEIMKAEIKNVESVKQTPLTSKQLSDIPIQHNHVGESRQLTSEKPDACFSSGACFAQQSAHIPPTSQPFICFACKLVFCSVFALLDHMRLEHADVYYGTHGSFNKFPFISTSRDRFLTNENVSPIESCLNPGEQPAPPEFNLSHSDKPVVRVYPPTVLVVVSKIAGSFPQPIGERHMLQNGATAESGSTSFPFPKENVGYSSQQCQEKSPPHLPYEKRLPPIITMSFERQQMTHVAEKHVQSGERQVANQSGLSTSQNLFKSSSWEKPSIKNATIVHLTIRYKCSICSQLFALESLLTNHMKRFHGTGDPRPYLKDTLNSTDSTS